MSKKVAQVIIETLEAAGVRNCYGIVGDTANRLAECIGASSIDWVHMRHEEAGAFAAQGEALLTGKLTAVMGSCGPGSLHFLNGVLEANRNRAPVIVIATQVVRDEIGFNFIQEVDFAPIYSSCTVFCEMILTPEQAQRKTALACQTAIAKRGVAVLIVPVDISNSDVADAVHFGVHARVPVMRPNDADLDQAAQILNAGKKIAIYGGSGCAGAHAQVMAVAERLKAPVAHTSRAKDALEWDNPHNVGMTGVLGNEAGYNAVLACDTLLLLGADFAWRQFYPDHAKIVQIDIDASHLGRRHPVDLGLVGDIKDSLDALLARLEEKTDRAFHDHYVKLHTETMETQRTRARPKPGRGISGIWLTELINRHAAEDALFTADAGTPLVWLYRHVDANGKRRMFSSLLHGTMAGAMPTALGLQKCQPGRQVISMSGDGGLSMLFGDLMTAVQENLPIKVVVFDNEKLAFIDIEQKSEGMIPIYTDLKNPEFGKVAAAMGFWGRDVSKPDELDEAVAEWLAAPGPALLSVKVENMTLVTPPAIMLGPAYGMVLYSARAVLNGRSGEVLEMIKENLP
jgi:pyruvate dehydrogenase (quinone)